MCPFSLDSPPVVLPLELEDTGGVTTDSDLDLDLDASADYGGRDVGVGAADGDEQMDFDGSDWIDFDFPNSEDRPTIGRSLGIHAPNPMTEVSSCILA